jgi:hypothetical protein
VAQSNSIYIIFLSTLIQRQVFSCASCLILFLKPHNSHHSFLQWHYSGRAEFVPCLHSRFHLLSPLPLISCLVAEKRIGES